MYIPPPFQQVELASPYLSFTPETPTEGVAWRVARGALNAGFSRRVMALSPGDGAAGTMGPDIIGGFTAIYNNSG